MCTYRYVDKYMFEFQIGCVVPRRSACFHQEGSVGLPSWSPQNIVEGRGCTFLCWGILEESFGGLGILVFFLKDDVIDIILLYILACLFKHFMYIYRYTYIYKFFRQPGGQTEIMSWYASHLYRIPSPPGQVEFIAQSVFNHWRYHRPILP